MQRAIEEHWSSFLTSVESLNAFRKPGVLRRYQESVLEHGRFEVASPYSGVTLPALCSERVGSRIAYLFFDQKHFWVLAHAIRFGYPLSDFIAERDPDTRHLFRSTPALNPNRQVLIQEQLRRAALDTRVRRAVPVLLIGDPNFAHHLWNELSALDEWLNAASDETIAGLKILDTAEPLGPLRRIFPRLRLASFISQEEISRIEETATAPMIVRLGSHLVTTRIREIIRRFSDRQANNAATDPICTVIENGWPRVWISVRQNSRTADNQMDFIIAILHRIFRNYPSATVVFDGFSYPQGFFEDPRTEPFRDSFVHRADAATEFIDALRLRAISEFGQPIGYRLCSISGLSLADAIHVGARCNYYICHAGTLQHKIAWLHNIPGFIHSPPHGEMHGRWHAYQVEGGIMPDMLPASLSVAKAAGHNKRKVSRNLNYSIVDVDRSADLVILSMQSRLSVQGAP